MLNKLKNHETSHIRNYSVVLCCHGNGDQVIEILIEYLDPETFQHKEWTPGSLLFQYFPPRIFPAKIDINIGSLNQVIEAIRHSGVMNDTKYSDRIVDNLVELLDSV